MKRVYDDIYLLDIPLRGNPLKSLNCFIVKTDGRNLIVDTGFNTRENQGIILNSLEKLEIDLEETALFLTHSHSDHTGLASFLENRGVKVYMSKFEGELLNDCLLGDSPQWKQIVDRAMLQGLGKDNLTLEEHPGYKYRPVDILNYIAIEPGEYLNIGHYNFEVVDLVGHTPGIIGLYDKDHRIFFCGDHILGQITPNITFWGFEEGDILGKYLGSLDKVYNMDIDYLFSSHRDIVQNHKIRIDEIKSHHEKRLEEIMSIIKKIGPSSVRTIAQNMSWDIRSKNWDEFPSSQKWFAAGEAHAHLERLRAMGQVGYEIVDDVIYYFVL